MESYLYGKDSHVTCPIGKKVYSIIHLLCGRSSRCPSHPAVTNKETSIYRQFTILSSAAGKYVMHPLQQHLLIGLAQTYSMVFALNMLQSVTSQARSDTLIVFSCSSSTVVLERSSFSALIYQSVTPLRTLGIIQKPHFPRPTLHSIQEHFPSSGYVYLPPSNVSPSHVHEPISSIYHPWIQTIDGFL